MKLHLLWIVFILSGCATSDPLSDTAHTPSYAIKPDTHSAMYKAIAPGAALHKDLSGFHLLPRGEEALLTRFALINSATSSIDLQYFTSNIDKTGKLLLQALLKAADRGVRIRVLIDGWDLDDFTIGALALSGHPHIEVRVFNPLAKKQQPFFAKTTGFFFRYDQFDRRMHNKAVIADSVVAVMGGRNLGDEYFGASNLFNFRDMDVFAAGPIVQKISANFDRFWNSEESYPLQSLPIAPTDPQETIQAREQLQQEWDKSAPSMLGPVLHGPALPARIRSGNFALSWANAEFTADKPGKIDVSSDDARSKPEAKIVHNGNDAQKEFIIISPYFVPLDDGVDWLSSLVKKGVKVRVLTNSLASTDMVLADAGYSHYREKLLVNGIELYELKAIGGHRPRHMFKGSSSQSSLHAKTYVIDRKDVFIGSFNFDPRSMSYNTEQLLTIHSPELAGQVADIFERAIAPISSYHLILTDTPQETISQTRQAQAPYPSVAPHIVWVTEEKGVTRYYDYDPQAGVRRSVTAGFISLLPIDRHL